MLGLRVGSNQVVPNALANGIGVLVASLMAIIVAPLAFWRFGPEGFALVALYLIMQAFLPVLDLGISGGVGRAVASQKSSQGLGSVRWILRRLGWPLLYVALVSLLAFAAAALFLAWRLDDSPEFSRNLVFLGLLSGGGALSVRLVGGALRSALMGLEDQVAVNIIATGVTVFRTVGALFVAELSRTGAVGFMVIQIPISIAEVLLYRARIRRLVGKSPADPVPAAALRSHIRLGLSVAVLTALWVGSSQLDRIFLSSVLPLETFGRFAFGVQLGASLAMACGAIQAALLPRLVGLVAKGHHEEAALIYLLGFRVTLSISLVVLLFLATLLPLLSLLTGGRELGVFVWQVMLVCALGLLPVMLLAMGYLMQNALGDLRLHFLMSAVQLVMTLLAILIVGSTHDGLALVATISGISYMLALVWVPLVRTRLVRTPEFGRTVGSELPLMIVFSSIVATVVAMVWWGGGVENRVSLTLVLTCSALVLVLGLVSVSGIWRRIGFPWRRETQS